MAERSLCDPPLPTNSVSPSNRPPKCIDTLSLSSGNFTQQTSSDDMDDLTPQPAISPKLHQPSDNEMEMSTNMFEHWQQPKQTQILEKPVPRMSFHHQEHISIMPLLQRDFITVLPNIGMPHIAYKILSYLDAQSLCRAEQVCVEWYQVIADGMLWKKLISQGVHIDPVWKGLSERRRWGQHLSRQAAPSYGINHEYFRRLYPCIIRDIQNVEANWRYGYHSLIEIECRNENGSDVYCLQHDDDKIVTGLEDNTIKIWELRGMQCTHVLRGHTGPVLCLQYDEKVIITGSSDSTIRVWDVNSGQMLNTLVQHRADVLYLRFGSTTMVTCSKDRTIAVWDIKSPKDIMLQRVLIGHGGGVNVAVFNDKYIVSGSGDQTIKVWQTSTSEFVRTLHGHRGGILCLQWRGNHVVSGSTDSTIRIWDFECGACLRLLEGHTELVTCIRFDDKRIVSGAYGGIIKVWDLEAALDPRTPENSLCLKTLSVHHRFHFGSQYGHLFRLQFGSLSGLQFGRLFGLQLDDFQIASSHHDGIILIRDFLNLVGPDPMDVESSPTLPSNRGHPNPTHRFNSVSVPGNHPIQEAHTPRIYYPPPHRFGTFSKYSL